MHFSFIIPKSKKILLYCISFISGVGIASFAPIDYLSDAFLFLFIALALFALSFFLGKKFNLILLMGFFLFLGLFRYSFALPADSEKRIAHFNGSEIIAEGKIVSDPRGEIDKERFVLEVEFLKNKQKRVDGKVLVFKNLYPESSYGEELKVKCELQKPKEFNGFAYDRYLAKSGIYSVCYYPKIEKIGSGDRDKDLLSYVYELKNRLRQATDKGLLEPEGAIFKAMILGDKRLIPDDVREQFSKAGLSHIMAISGMHIGILIAIIFWALISGGLMRKYAFYTSTALLVFYIILIGFPASAVRAGVMGFLVLLSLNLGRLNRITNSLVIAAVIMLLFNPFLLRDDIGFQLSFLAVLGIIYFFEPISNYLKEKLNKIEIKLVDLALDIVSITLSAQILILPIIAWNFSQVSLVSPISNLLVIWLLPVLLVAGIAALVLSLLIPAASLWLFLPLQFILKYIIAVAEFMSSLPTLKFSPTNFSILWVAVYYLVILFLFMFIKTINEERESFKSSS